MFGAVDGQHYSAPEWERDIVMRVYVCLSVCPLAYPRKHASLLYQIFNALWSWLGFALPTLQQAYLMYVQFVFFVTIFNIFGVL